MTKKYKQKNKMLKELWDSWTPNKKGQKKKMKDIARKYKKI